MNINNPKIILIMEISKNYQASDAEKRWIDRWRELGIYHFEQDSNKPVFSVDTPPPYVNSDHLHIGHAMSYIQAEIIIRYKRMQGFNIFYPMGFDDNGLPTERFVEAKYKINKSAISRQEFIALCIEETKKGALNYRSFWESLGISVDWSLTYNTIGDLSQKISQKSFIDFFQKGLVYQQEAPTFWCPVCQTALAQADLEDKEEKSKMFYLKFFSPNFNQEIIIATTRPELLPACVALYVNPHDDRYRHLIGSQAIVPLFGNQVPILSDAEVDSNLGTGAMMVCTWGDAEDVRRWKTDKLDTRLLIGHDGRLNENAGEFQGLKINAARQAIVQRLKDCELLIKEEEIIHVKKVHERCDAPVEFLTSKQWFINILDNKEKFLLLGNDFLWNPEFMKIRYDDWVANLKWDWCISRDRYYGVPFPLWHCADCGAIVLPETEMLPVDPRDKTPENLFCPNCGGKKLIGEEQVMDTWMTSSLSPLINARWLEPDSLIDKIYPFSLRVQAFEIIRTWLFYTVVKSWFHTNSIPWKSVMISGWGLDKHGKKMSKSKGNIVKIDDAVNQYSADAVRWWSTGSSLGNNLKHSEVDLQSGKKLVNKFWNVARFIKPLIDNNYEASLSAANSNNLLVNFSDRWIMAELQKVLAECTKALDACNFNKARIILEKFFWLKYCDNYLELCKDRVWKPEKYTDDQIKSLHYTLATSMDILLKLFAPILPFVSEEIYHVLFNKADNESIHVAKWPEKNEAYHHDELLDFGTNFLDIIGKIRHFKSTEIKSLRAEISRLSIVSENQFVAEALPDLAGLAGAKEVHLNASENPGQHYESYGSNIYLIAE
ncbi:MAG: valine--tRNA ligase [Patescibacteria group bacterium]